MPAPGRRDRRGRGLRGRLLRPAVEARGAMVPVPAYRTRTEAFDALVGEVVARLERRWESELAAVELAVEDVPDPALAGEDGVVCDETAGGGVPLGRVVRTAGAPTRVVVYRRPLEARAEGQPDLAELVRDVVVELLAELLGIDPDEVDPQP